MTVIHYVDSVCALGHTSRGLVGVWRGGLMPARVDAMVSLGARAKAAAGGERVGSLSVVIQLPDMKKGVDAQTRDLSKELTAKMEPYSMCGAQVFEGTGLWISAVRMLVSVTMIAGKASVPNKVFNSVDEAAPWLQAQARAEPVEIVEAVRVLREKLVAMPMP